MLLQRAIRCRWVSEHFVYQKCLLSLGPYCKVGPWSEDSCVYFSSSSKKEKTKSFAQTFPLHAAFNMGPVKGKLIFGLNFLVNEFLWVVSFQALFNMGLYG